MKMEINGKIKDVEIQEEKGRILLHCEQSHAADIEFFACFEKLKKRLGSHND